MNAILSPMPASDQEASPPANYAISVVENTGWQAYLRLGFSLDHQTTRLTDREHHGPLRVQKALYPEGDKVCHVLVLHPPGGVVGGDALSIDIKLAAATQVLLSNPGAAKWYKSNGKVSKQRLHFQVAHDACLEWMPQETIFYNHAEVDLEHLIELQGNARCLICEIQCFGRTASGETFEQGRIRQKVQIKRDGHLLWFEQASINAPGSSMTSTFGLRHHTVNANFIVVGDAIPVATIRSLREAAFALLSAGDEFGVTQIKQLVSVRYLGDSSERARQLILLAWHYLRPVAIGREAVDLRIWRT